MKNAPVRHAVEYALLVPFLGLVRLLPHTANRRLGAALGSLASLVDRRRNRIARTNLAAAFPEKSAGDWSAPAFVTSAPPSSMRSPRAASITSSFARAPR